MNTLQFIKSKKFQYSNPSWIRRFTNFSFILFFALLPFHSIDWSIVGIDRFEFKVTMIPFVLMVIACSIDWYFSPQHLSKEEKFFYALAITYGVSQFASLLYSPYPSKSFIQGIIVAILLTMVIVISRILKDRELILYAYRTMGVISLAWGLYVLVTYQLVTHAASRLGSPGTIFIHYWQGDPASFGDVLLFVTGAVYWIFFSLAEKRVGRFVIWLLIPLWLHLFTLTYTKALIIAGFFFFVLGAIFLRAQKRFIMAMSGILFLFLNIFSGPILRYERAYTERLNIARFFEPAPEPPTPPVHRDASAAPEPPTPPVHREPTPEPLTPAEVTAAREYSINRFLLTRLNPMDPTGAQSFYIRLKGIRVSIQRSFDHFFGNGAGLSQVLLPKFADDFDAKLSPHERARYENMDRWGSSIYGSRANTSLIDAHNLFLTELFNVGIIGFLALVGLVVLVIKLQVHALQQRVYRHDPTNILLFSTFIALLMYRMAGSYIVVPYFWVMLGVLFGLSQRSGKVQLVAHTHTTI